MARYSYGADLIKGFYCIVYRCCSSCPAAAASNGQLLTTWHDHPGEQECKPRPPSTDLLL